MLASIRPIGTSSSTTRTRREPPFFAMPLFKANLGPCHEANGISRLWGSTLNPRSQNCHPVPNRGREYAEQSMAWDPAQYLKFADHRLRPAIDLLNRIDLADPGEVVDLGAGAGNVTKLINLHCPNPPLPAPDPPPH